jgi:hypothetical protein
MTKKLLLLAILFLVSVPASAQFADTAWVRRYGGGGYDYAWAMVVDDSGNVYVTGTSGTLKYDRNGNQLWMASLSGADITVDSFSNVYVAGYYDYVTVKYYPDGDTAWVRTYGSGVGNARAIAVDGDGNVYVTGTSNNDYVTIKYYPNGDTAWLRTYSSFQDYANALAIDVSGNVYVTGCSNGNYATVKYYPNGDTAWVRTYDGPGYYTDEANAIAIDKLGNIIVTGVSRGSETADDYATIKYYPNGDTAWVRRYNGEGNGNDRAHAIAVDGLGNVYVAGGSDGIGTDLDYATIKYDQDGNELWVRRYNGPGNWWDEANAIAIDGSGNVFVGGNLSCETTWDYGTIKYDSDGNKLWVKTYNGPGNDQERAWDVVVDASNNVYVTGFSIGNGTSADYATIKYVQYDSIPFTSAVNYGAGTYSLSVFCADLDGDGDPDLAVANPGSGNVSILKNNGDGTYQSAVNYGAGSAPWSVFCADLDGDGHPDLAVANFSSNNVSILKNNGWTFQSAVNYGAGIGPRSVFCADLDGDGDLDLAVANKYGSSVSILKNNGDATFQSAVNYGTGSSPASVFCADLDGDGALDLAVANGNNVSILKNNGDGTFQTAVNYGTGSSPAAVFCADLDGDRDLDLAVASGNGVSILKNNGDGTFQSSVNYGTGLNSHSVFCADLDGDNDLDLAVANANSNNVSILKNNGDGTFQGTVNYGTGGSPFSVFCADLDGDNDLDLAVANYDDNNLSILRNLTQVPANQPPYPFPLLSPTNGDSVRTVVVFDWGTSYDPFFPVRYDLYLSTSLVFPPDSTVIYSNLAFSEHTDTLGVGTHYWKVKGKDSQGPERWSDQSRSFYVFKLGDVNADSGINLADVRLLANYILKGGPAPHPLQSGDVNCDGKYDLVDVIKLARYVLLGVPFPC